MHSKIFFFPLTPENSEECSSDRAGSSICLASQGVSEERKFQTVLKGIQQKNVEIPQLGLSLVLGGFSKS